MQKIFLILTILATVNSAVLAGSAYDKALDRNMAEFGDYPYDYARELSKSYGNAPLIIFGVPFPTLGDPYLNILQPSLEGHDRR